MAKEKPTCKSFLLGIVVWVTVLNMIFFITVFSMLIALNFTGDLVTEWSLSSGTYESNFTLTNTKDLTFILSPSGTSSPMRENLKINITDPNGLRTSWTKGFFTFRKGTRIWSQDSDSTFIVKPTTTGVYDLRITVTGGNFPTNLKIKSGMINVQKEDLFFAIFILNNIAMAIFLFIGGMFGYNLTDTPSKKIFLIALLTSLVITFIVTYYSSI